MKSPIEHISFAETNTSSVINALIAFDTIIDIDFGILTLISQHGPDVELFDEIFFKNNNTISSMLESVVERECKNPLDLCWKKSSIDSVDYLNRYIKDNYCNILERSIITDFGHSLKLFASSSLNFAILCNNEIEREFLKSLKEFSNYTILLNNELENPDFYNQFIFKSLDDKNLDFLSRLIVEKTVYIANYKFNTNIVNNKIELKPNKNFAKMVIMRNKFSIIDLYAKEGDKKSND